MRDLSDKVYAQLKADLMNETFALDELINEQVLVEKYGVSRTPVREAAMRLVHEGYLNKFPKKGYTIRCVSEDELAEIETCRYILESGVIELIIAHASDDEIKGLLQYMKEKPSPGSSLIQRGGQFHLNMVQLTGNAHLEEILTNLLYMSLRPAASSQRRNLDNYRSMAIKEGFQDVEHVEIVQALLERDVEKAKKLLRKDISNIMPFAV